MEAHLSALPRKHCTTPSIVNAPVFASVARPRSSTIPVIYNGLQINALIDSGNTIGCIHHVVVMSLSISVFSSKADITLVASQTSTTLRYCFVELKVKDTRYPHYKLSVLPQFCSMIILGQNFMEKNQAMECTLNGTLPKLTICEVASMNIDPPSVFPNLSPDIRPISTSICKFTKSDQVFIHEKIHSLLLKGII